MSNNIVKNPDVFRDNIRKQFRSFFENEKDAVNLEKGIYNWCLKESTNKKVIKKWDNHFFVQIYKDRLRTIFLNLKNNNRLINMVNSGEIKSQEIANMTHYEIRPDKWDAYIQAKTIRDKNKYEQNIEAMTDAFTCRKCKSKRSIYYEQMSRSADEPMTIYITCIDCGNRMKK
jgi:DNA-directed RNA polymerase subunit M/transcription elongation factor TFIIS